MVTGNYHFSLGAYSERNRQIWGRDPGAQHVFLMVGLSGMHEKNVWVKMTRNGTGEHDTSVLP